MSDRIVITGGAGFIGSHLAERLLAEGASLVLVDDFSTGRRANVAHLPAARCERVEARVGEALAARPGLLEGAAAVYHLAATVGVKRVLARPVETIRNNLEETGRLVEAAAAAGVPLLLASTSEVYGRSDRLPLREEEPLVYGPTTVARWSYGMSKALDEHLVLAARRERGLEGVIVRLFNTVGPRQLGDYGMVVPRFLEQAMKDGALTVYGDGRQSRTFCHVRDVVEGMVRLMADPAAHAERVFNLGSDAAVTIDALALRVIDLAGGGRREYRSFEAVYGPGFEEMRHRVPDLARIRAAVGFEPRTSLDEILRELIAAARG